MRNLLSVLVVIVALAVAGAAPTDADALADVEAADPTVLSILVMGDSYSAGNGAGSYYGAHGCYRSAFNYAREYERILESAPYRQRGFVENVACSGDTTDAVFRTTSGRPPQLNAVNHGYSVIFLTIGGNDIHFGDIVKFCLVAATRDAANCGPNLSRAESLIADGTMRKRIASVLSAVAKKADPRARIVLLGYPYLEGDPNYRLRSGRGGNTFINVGKRVRALGAAGEGVQQQAVNQLNAESRVKPFVFVSVQKLFAGPPTHELFAQRTNSDRWMVQPGVDASRLTIPTYYHPNPTGWRREAELLSRDARVPKRPIAATSGPPVITAITTTGAIGVRVAYTDPDGCAGLRFAVALQANVEASDPQWRTNGLPGWVVYSAQGGTQCSNGRGLFEWGVACSQITADQRARLYSNTGWIVGVMDPQGLQATSDLKLTCPSGGAGGAPVAPPVPG